MSFARAIRGFLAVGVLMLSASLPTPAADPPAPRWDDWTRLQLRVRGVPLMSGSIDVNWKQAPNGDRLLEGETVAKLLGASLLRSATRTRLDPRDGSVVEYIDLQSDRGRHYHFGPTGYRVAKLQPERRGRPRLPGVDAGLPGWKVTSEKEFPAPAPSALPARDCLAGDPCRDGTDDPVPAPPARDFLSTLMTLDTLPLERAGDATIVWIGSSKGPQGYVLELGEERQHQRRLRSPWKASRRRIATREIGLSIRPLDPERTHKGFMGMEGTVEVWLERDSKTLLSVSGRLPRVGTVRLELARLE